MTRDSAAASLGVLAADEGLNRITEWEVGRERVVNDVDDHVGHDHALELGDKMAVRDVSPREQFRRTSELARPVGKGLATSALDLIP
jgi:hypothetical protein